MSNTRLKYLTILSSAYMAVVLLTMFIESRMISVFSFHIVTGTLIIPVTYSLSDIITEVYGYNEMRRLLWSSIFILYVIALVLYILMKFPSPPSAVELNNAYEMVVHPFLRDVFTYSVAAFAGIFLNSYLLSKWKILVSGRLFWMRSLGSSAIGEIIFTLVFGMIAFLGVYPLKDIVSIIGFSFVYKFISNLLAIIPASLLVQFLKRAENIDVYDNAVSFNPFLLH